MESSSFDFNFSRGETNESRQVVVATEEERKKKTFLLRPFGSCDAAKKEEALKDMVVVVPSSHQQNNANILLTNEKETVRKREFDDNLFCETRCNDEIKEYISPQPFEESISSSKNFYVELVRRFEKHLNNEFLIFASELLKENVKKRTRLLFEHSYPSSPNKYISVVKESRFLTEKIERIKKDVILFIEGGGDDSFVGRCCLKDETMSDLLRLKEKKRRSGILFIRNKVTETKQSHCPIEMREKILSTFRIGILLNSDCPVLLNEQDKKFSEELDETSTLFSVEENKNFEVTSPSSTKSMSTVTSSFFTGNDGSSSVGQNFSGGGVAVIKRFSKRGSGGGGSAAAASAAAQVKVGGGVLFRSAGRGVVSSVRQPQGGTSNASARILEDTSSFATRDETSLQAKINECRAQFESRSRPLRPFDWGESIITDKDISKPKSAMSLKKSLLSDVLDLTSPTGTRSAVGVFGVQAAIWTIRKDKDFCHPFVRFAGEELKTFQFEKALADIEDTFHGGIPLDRYSAPQFDKRCLETHTKLALMESLVSVGGGGGPINGAKASELSVSEDIGRLFTAPSFFDSDKDSLLLSMLFPLISSYRMTPGTSHWDNVGRALLSTFPQKNFFDTNIGVDLWAEVTAQKMFVMKIREWILEKASSESTEIKEMIENVCERKIISWILKRTGNGYKTFEENDDEGQRRPFDFRSIKTSRDEFDVLYQPRMGQVSKPSEVFKAVANDPFFRRNFGLFAYEMAPDVFQRYSEIGHLTHDFLRFREENFQSYRHEHGRDQARFLDERADLNERSDMSTETTLPFVNNDGGGGDGPQKRSEDKKKKRTLKMVSEPFCDDTVLCDRGILTKQNQGGRASWHLSEAARVTGERNVYMCASPEDLEWDSAKEANCVLMFFHSVRNGMIQSIEERRKIQLERLSETFDVVRKIQLFSGLTSDGGVVEKDDNLLLNAEMIDELISSVTKMKHQEDVNATIELYLSSLRDKVFMKRCQDRFEEFKKEIQRSITVRTVGGFAREDSSLYKPEYDTWHLKWAMSSLSNALEKDNRERMMGKFAARILWQTYLCVPKTDLGSACGASWYKFDEFGHNLRPITGTSEIIDDIVKYIGGIVAPSAETSAVIGDRTVRKHKTLEGNVRLNPIQLETILEGGNRLLEISKTMTEIKKMINTDRGCKTVIDAMKTEKIIRCEQFNSLKNTDPNLIAFLNGVFDTGGEHSSSVCTFRSGKIEDFITMSTKMAVPYGGMIQPVGMVGARLSSSTEAKKSQNRRYQNSLYSDHHEDVKFMMNYLRKVFPDEEILSYAIRDMASMLFGANGEKIFRIWSGGGNNSKSILVKILQYGFGDYCFDLPAESICSKQMRNPSGPSPELAQGEGSRIGVMTEPADGVELDSGIIKRFTGGDRIHVRKLHENGGSIVASYKLILCCNDPPHLSQIDTATKNRVVILPFVSTWVDNPPPSEDAQMAARRFKIDPSFQAQAPRLARALMWKLIHSYSDYKKVGIMERPKIMQEYVDTFWKTVDKYHSFKEQFVEEAPGETLVTQDLYNAFAPWDLSQNPGSRAVGYGKFKQNMCRKDHLGPTSNIPGGKEGWSGFRIKMTTSSPSPSPSPSSPTPTVSV